MAITLNHIQRKLQETMESKMQLMIAEKDAEMRRQMNDLMVAPRQPVQMNARQSMAAMRTRVEARSKWAIQQIERAVGESAESLCMTPSQSSDLRKQALELLHAGIMRSVTAGDNEAEQIDVIGTLTKQIVEDRKLLPVFDPNNIASLVMELSALKDLWIVVLGKTWIKSNDVRPPDGQPAVFWKYAYQRLAKHDMFEEFEGWVRLKEGA